MSLHFEKINAIRNTRDFLRELLDRSKTPRVPKKVREAAYYCLKHYPWEHDIQLMAEVLRIEEESRSGSKPVKVPEANAVKTLRKLIDKRRKELKHA